MFINNKYRTWYYAIVDRAQKRDEVLNQYTETHHIIPQCLNGGHESENLVVLTFREHFLCHWLLTKMTKGMDRKRMQCSLIRMVNTQYGRVVSGWHYALVKAVAREAMKGPKHTEQSKAILRELRRLQKDPRIGTHHTEESRRKIGRTRIERGIGHTKESKAKISKALEGNQYRTGILHTEKTKRQMSQQRMGNKHRLGTKDSEETKRKKGEATRRRHEANRARKAKLTDQSELF